MLYSSMFVGPFWVLFSAFRKIEIWRNDVHNFVHKDAFMFIAAAALQISQAAFIFLGVFLGSLKSL